MNEDLTFRGFVERRKEFLLRFDELRRDIDRWIETKAATGSMTDLAYFEALLIQRREVLGRLRANDDRLIEYLIQHRSSATTR